MEKLILSCNLCPGDLLTLTAAIESLHASFPGRYETDVRCSVPEIFEHNPWITSIPDGEGRWIKCDYPTIHESNSTHCQFLDGYARHIGSLLKIDLRLTVNSPRMYLTEQEKAWLPQVHEATGKNTPYWLVNSGVKSDYTTKQWPVEYYQHVVNETRGWIQWVQVGAADAGHKHVRLQNAIDMVGMTDHRQFARMVYHSSGAVGPVSYLQHMSAAFGKPYICLLGGREPVTWVSYPKQHTMHSIGALPCCRDGGCWKSKVVRGSCDEAGSLCELPMVSFLVPVGKCMSIIKPDSVVQALELYR